MKARKEASRASVDSISDRSTASRFVPAALPHEDLHVSDLRRLLSNEPCGAPNALCTITPELRRRERSGPLRGFNMSECLV